mmetsp:Transcript_4724/g.9122  ORF Transcript_4724/g.9122 Transcript_4724/m.9122 type:complete len:88 (-) Transcript_4724:1016-1279(-)
MSLRCKHILILPSIIPTAGFMFDFMFMRDVYQHNMLDGCYVVRKQWQTRPPGGQTPNCAMSNEEKCVKHTFTGTRHKYYEEAMKILR